MTNIFILSSRISALEKTLVSKDNSRTVSHHSKLAFKLKGNGEIENISSSFAGTFTVKNFGKKMQNGRKEDF
jgi:hypothetical protein